MNILIKINIGLLILDIYLITYRIIPSWEFYFLPIFITISMMTCLTFVIYLLIQKFKAFLLVVLLIKSFLLLSIIVKYFDLMPFAVRDKYLQSVHIKSKSYHIYIYHHRLFNSNSYIRLRKKLSYLPFTKHFDEFKAGKPDSVTCQDEILYFYQYSQRYLEYNLVTQKYAKFNY